MGKSRLISELARRAEASDMTVAVGECVPLAEGAYAPIVVAHPSSTRPLAPLNDRHLLPGNRHPGDHLHGPRRRAPMMQAGVGLVR